MTPTLASINYSSPLFWAVMIGWMISVILHEFAHGLVACLGGDYTIRERGGLSLNPLQYADPVMSFALPLVFLLMGSVPLMGGATYIRTDLLRSRLWRSAVSLAGPLMNLILFFICIIPLHPRFGWVDLSGSPETWSPLQMFCGALAALQLIAVQVNLIPLPPLDGFNAIQGFLPADMRRTLSNPQLRMFLMLGLFVTLYSGRASQIMFENLYRVLHWIGFDEHSQEFIRRSFNSALFGATD